MNRLVIIVDPNLTRNVRELSTRMGTSPLVTMLAALQTLLSRYSGLDAIAVSVPVQRRRDTVEEKGTGQAEAFETIRGDLAGNPAFSVLLTQLWERAATVEVSRELPPYRFDLIPVDGGCDQFQACIGYEPGSFSADQMHHLAGHFRSLLADATARPHERIGNLELLTAEEHGQVQAEWHATEIENPRNEFIHDLVSKQAARTPLEIAVICGSGQLTYREMESRANQLAWYLRSCGVGPEVVTGVCLERSSAMVVALLAVLKAGGAYLPLDPDYPKARLEFMLNDSGAHVLITERSAGDVLQNWCGCVVNIDDVGSPDNPIISPRVRLRPDHPAYVIYTSGSTGVPKGVMVQHRGAVNHLTWAARTYSLSAADVTLGFSSISFDASVRQIFAPLIVGSRLIVLTRAQQMNIRAIVELVSTQRVSVIISSFPSLWRELLPYLCKLSRHATALRLTAIGGESFRSMPSEGLDRLGAIYNQYGPTECTISASYRLMNGTNDSLQSQDEIGKPIANMRIYVLDRFCQLLPVGVPGEAYIAGCGLARGYLNRPGLTAAHFVANPFGKPGERMYRSGDLVRRLPNGHLEFLGRLDNQVKLNGLRIELGEIESTLRSHPSVDDVLVTVTNRSGLGGQVGAFVIARSGASHESALLRAYLRARLPAYMIPETIIFVDNFPRQPNGKVDRKEVSERLTLKQSEVSSEDAFADVWTAAFNDIQ